MLPIPDHLKKFLQVDLEKSEGNELAGKLCCPCDGEKFKVSVFAIGEEGFPEVGSYQDDYAFVIRAMCATCGEDWLVFDLSKHGYDGFVCHEGVSVPDSALKGINCSGCHGENFMVSLVIQIEDKEQFLEEIVQDDPFSFKKDDYVNAFGWIEISLKCGDCQQEIPAWVSLETA